MHHPSHGSIVDPGGIVQGFRIVGHCHPAKFAGGISVCTVDSLGDGRKSYFFIVSKVLQAAGEIEAHAPGPIFLNVGMVSHGAWRRCETSKSRESVEEKR